METASRFDLAKRFGPLVLFSHPEALQVILANDDAKLFDAPGSSNVTLELITGTQSVFAEVLQLFDFA
jgi:hypothetical protein